MSAVEVQHSRVFVIVSIDGLVWSRLCRWTDEPERFMLYEKPAT